MNRRGFLATLAGALVADPEKLLWRPDKKLISIPKPLVFSGYAPGRIDFLALKEWFRIEVKPVDYYEINHDFFKGYFECRLVHKDQLAKTPAFRSL